MRLEFLLFFIDIIEIPQIIKNCEQCNEIPCNVYNFQPCFFKEEPVFVPYSYVNFLFICVSLDNLQVVTKLAGMDEMDNLMYKKHEDQVNQFNTL